jgi:hypothetical protein
VGEIRATRSGIEAYVKCPVAGARKLAQAGNVALGWSTARVIAIPKRPLQSKRPLQCYKCLELRDVRATCVSTAKRGHLCYRCGGSGHRARECPASAPRCPLCESLGVPANHRMAGTACTPPKTRRLARKRNILPRTSRHGKNTGMPCHRRRRQRTTPATAAVDGQGEAMELAQ